MQTRKLGILLIAVSFPLIVNAATFGPEVPVAQPQHFSAFGGQSSEAVACGDQSCVALWSEWAVHSGLYSSVIDANGNVQPASGHTDDSLFDINAVAVDVQGTVLLAYPRGNAEDGIPQMVTRQVFNAPPRGRGVRR